MVLEQKSTRTRMNLWNETKSVPISRSMIWNANKHVKANKGSAGVDEIGWAEFESNRSKQLYKLWNRMLSGSYLSLEAELFYLTCNPIYIRQEPYDGSLSRTVL